MSSVNMGYRIVDDDEGVGGPDGLLDIDQIQEDIIRWQTHNFGNVSWREPLMGVVEELGELHHALLKQEQKIRGSHEFHEANAKDAVGDLGVYLLAFCAKRGWKFSDILEETWIQVGERDWIRFPKDGLTE